MNGFGGEMHHIQDVVCKIWNRWELSKIVWQQTVGTILPPIVRAKFAKNRNLHGVENNTSKHVFQTSTVPNDNRLIFFWCSLEMSCGKHRHDYKRITRQKKW